MLTLPLVAAVVAAHLSLESAGEILGVQIAEAVEALPDGQRPSGFALYVEPVDDAKRLAPVHDGLRRTLVEAGLAWQDPSGGALVAAQLVVTLRAMRRDDGHALIAQALDVATGTTIAEPMVRVAPSALPDTLAVAYGDVDTLALRLAGSLAGALEQVPGDIRYQRVAVMPFDERGKSVKDARAGEALAIQLQKVLREQFGMNVVERKQLQKLLEQQAFAQGIGDDTRSLVGQMLDVQALVMGDVAEAGDQFLVNVRAISVTTGEVLDARAARVPRKGVISMASKLIELKEPAQAAFRSALIPGWGQIYMGSTVRGAIAMAACFAVTGLSAALLGIALATAAAYLLINPIQGPGFDVALPSGETSRFGLPPILKSQQFAGAAEPWRTGAAILFVVAAGGLVLAGASWALNVADAYTFSRGSQP